jgi:Kef-type K+ transport system membrane component KefB
MNAILLIIIGLLFLSKIVVGICERFKIQAALAELVLGLVVGFIAKELGYSVEAWVKSEVFHVFSELGVLLLLFTIGLETDIKEMKKVGVESFLAATLGVVVPFILALGVLPLFFEKSFTHDLFMAAALTATSVGITARVFKDLNLLSSISGRVVLGAAVIDDVLGILVLTGVTAFVSSSEISAQFFIFWALKTIGFAAVLWFLGKKILPGIITYVRKIETTGTVLGLLLCFLFLTAYIAELSGLSAIIGAFAIGVALDDYHFKGYKDYEKFGLEVLIKPLTDFFVPIFFIGMGMQVDIHSILDKEIFIFALLLTLCAIIGKLVCGLALSRKSIQKGGSRLLVGVGMIPRGEVGLIFASVGSSIGVLNQADFSAVVFMVVVTTLLAPLFIQWVSRSIRADKSAA